jgi:hypothetical protein
MGHLSIARAVQFAAASVDSDVAGWDSLDRGSVSGATGIGLEQIGHDNSRPCQDPSRRLGIPLDQCRALPALNYVPMETNPDVIQIACSIRRRFGRRAAPLVKRHAEGEDPDAGEISGRA